ncbi:MAG: PBP1A family penicillin-binding protein [Albidovulum sp.]|nr:PBP1A family penicillin-binding protein [Albidovulum sp.]
MCSWICLGFAVAAWILGALVWSYGSDLPSYAQLTRYQPPTISRIYSREGRLIDEFARERRLFVPIDEIPKIVKSAFISAEDKHFYTHKGFDPVGIVKAAVEAMREGKMRGASTITQQVMKNFLLGGERSVPRKIKELILAFRIENVFEKSKILELYLNEIFLGQNSYGVAAAAQTYFNKSLEELRPEEAAYLAALPKAPSTYHPVRQHERALARRNFVLREMVQNGFLDPAEGAEAEQAPLRTVQQGHYSSFRSSLPPRGYFTDEIRRQLSSDFGADAFFGGGLTIRATIDPELQEIATAALREGLEEFDRSLGIWRGTGIRLVRDVLSEKGLWRAELAKAKVPRDIAGWHPAVVLAIDSDSVELGVDAAISERTIKLSGQDRYWKRHYLSDGRLSKMARSVADILGLGEVVYVSRVVRDSEGKARESWMLRQIPEVQGAFMAMDANNGRVLAMQGGFSYQETVFNRATQATRQPGSTFKPFVYAAALDSGHSPATIVMDAPIALETDAGIWQPKNASGKFFGPVTLRTGIEYSRNLMTVRLANEVGMDTIAGYAENFGVYEKMQHNLANSLGAQESTLYRIVAAYAMFANGGERVEPTLVDRVQDRYGKTIYRHDKRLCHNCAERFLEPGSLPRVTANRVRVVDPVTAYQITSMMQGVVRRGTAAGYVDAEFPVAGKTGTTNESKDAWFVGYTPEISAGCYIGYDLPRSLGRQAFGGVLCGPVFSRFIEAAVEKYGSSDFKIPDGGTFVEIDRATGLPIRERREPGFAVDKIEPVPGGERGGIAMPDADLGTAPIPESQVKYSAGDRVEVIAEFFRRGTEPDSVPSKIVDGGFPFSSDLPFVVENGSTAGRDDESEAEVGARTDSESRRREKSSFDSMSSGGLY